MEEYLGSREGIVTLCLGAAFLALLAVHIYKTKMAFREEMDHVATELSLAGVPADLGPDACRAGAMGNHPKALGKFVKAAEALRTTDGKARFVVGILTSAHGDPIRWAKVTDVFTKLNNGASAAEVQAAAVGMVDASPLGKLTGGVLAQRLDKVRDVVAHIKTVARNPHLADVLQHLHDVGMSELGGLVEAGSILTPPVTVTTTDKPSTDTVAKE